MPSPRNSTKSGAKTAVRPYASPSLEVIGQLEVANTLSQIEQRLDSIELDLTRAAASREAESRRLGGEMAVLKARIDDALDAVTETAQDLRDAWVSIDEKIAALVDGRVSGQHRAIEALRAQLSSGLDATRLAVEAAEARLHGEVEALSGTNVEQVRGISELVDKARARIDEAVASVEGRVGEAIAGRGVDAGALDEQLHDITSRLRDEMMAREKDFNERIGEVADRIAEVAGSFDAVTGKLAGTEARIAGGRAGTDASVAVLSQQVKALEARVVDLTEEVATKTTERIEAMSGQVAEVREAILRVAERVGTTAFLTRRVADLEIRVAEVVAKLDRPLSI